MSTAGDGSTRKPAQRLTQRDSRPPRKLFASVRDAASPEGEARFRSYIEYAPLAVFVIDGAGRCVEANRCASQMLGYDRETLAGMGLDDAVLEEDREAARAGLGTVLRTGFVKGRFRLRARAGGADQRLSAGRPAQLRAADRLLPGYHRSQAGRGRARHHAASCCSCRTPNGTGTACWGRHWTCCRAGRASTPSGCA